MNDLDTVFQRFAERLAADLQRASSTIFVLLAPILLTACGGPISGNVLKDLGEDISKASPQAGEISVNVTTALKEASFNFDNAVLVGALAANDPAPGCLRNLMKDLGIGSTEPAAPSFTPQTDTLLGKGSVVYIRLRQAQGLSGKGIDVSIDCKALLGTIMIDAARGSRVGIPGGVVLPRLQ